MHLHCEINDFLCYYFSNGKYYFVDDRKFSNLFSYLFYISFLYKRFYATAVTSTHFYEL